MSISAAASSRRLAAPTTMRQRVGEQLRGAIIAGELRPGQLVTETEIALRLGVSATPVREALLDLSAEGLVEIEAHRLRRVAPIDFAATLDLLRVQAALWRLGYVWGLAKIGDGELDRLEVCLAAYRQALALADLLAVIRAAHEFHTVFVAATGNAELLRVTLDRRSLIARFIVLRGRSTLSAAGLRQHRAMLLAVRRGNTAEVLARLDQLAARMIAMAQEENRSGTVFEA